MGLLDDDYHDVRFALLAWSRWRRQNHGANVGFPSQSSFARFIKSQGFSNVPLPPMSDDHAMRVDGAMAVLKQRCEGFPGDRRWQVLTDVYLNCWPHEVIAQRRKIGRNKVREIRLQGESWIEAKLFDDS